MKLFTTVFSLFVCTIVFGQVPYIVNKNGVGTNATLRGTTLTDTIVSTNLVGNGSGISNINTSTQSPNTFTPNAYGNGSNFVWMATAGRKSILGNSGAGGVGLWLSLDGTNWNKAATRDVFNPNQFTNAFTGPYNTKWSLLFTNGQWWAASPHDTAGMGGLAQGIDLWKTADLTNWTREKILYPMGTTNANGRIFDATWFRDTDSSAWLTFSYATSNTTPDLIFSIHSLDGSLTNWGAKNLIKDTDVTQEGLVARTANGMYHLFYRCHWGGLEYLRATNNNLTSLFVLAPDAAGGAVRGTNFGWGSFANNGNAGGLTLLNVGGIHWRAYLTDESAASSTTMSYLDSFDDMATWAANWTTMATMTNYFGHGVTLAPAASTNILVALGDTNRGQVVIRTPLLKADSVQAGDGLFNGGLLAGSLFTPGMVTAGGFDTKGTFTGDSLSIQSTFGGSNTVDLSAGNIVLDAAGNLLVGSITADGSGLTSMNASSVTNPITSQSANYNIQTADSVILLNGNLTATLPTAVGIPGKNFIIVCKTSGTNGILSTSGQTFLGYGSTAALKWTNSVVGRSTWVTSDGANWIVIKSDN